MLLAPRGIPSGDSTRSTKSEIGILRPLKCFRAIRLTMVSQRNGKLVPATVTGEKDFNKLETLDMKLPPFKKLYPEAGPYAPYIWKVHLENLKRP